MMILFAEGGDILGALHNRFLPAGGPRLFAVRTPESGPVYGPQPAVCTLDPHPRSPWHCDGRGTWWC